MKNVIEFILATHTKTGQPLVEVWRGNTFVAGIYGQEGGVQLVSKYLDGVEHTSGYPPAVFIKLSEKEKDDLLEREEVPL